MAAIYQALPPGVDFCCCNVIVASGVKVCVCVCVRVRASICFIFKTVRKIGCSN